MPNPSLRKFKRTLGNYYTDKLKKLPPKHRQGFQSFILAMTNDVKYHDWVKPLLGEFVTLNPSIRNVCENAPFMFQTLQKTWPDFIPVVLEDCARLSGKDAMKGYLTFMISPYLATHDDETLYTRWVRLLERTSANHTYGLGDNLLDEAHLLLTEKGDLFRTYIDCLEKLGSQDDRAPDAYHTRVFGAILELRNARETPTQDRVLLRCIDAPSDANAIGPLIDRKTNKKEYAERIRQFYG